jgi:hypothetical protein
LGTDDNGEGTHAANGHRLLVFDLVPCFEIFLFLLFKQIGPGADSYFPNHKWYALGFRVLEVEKQSTMGLLNLDPHRLAQRGSSARVGNP